MIRALFYMLRFVDEPGPCREDCKNEIVRKKILNFPKREREREIPYEKDRYEFHEIPR